MRLIGINGLKGSGKDTVYELLRDNTGDTLVKRVAFADKLKIMAGRSLGYEGPDDEIISTMNRFKNDGLIVSQMNLLGGNGFDDTILGEAKTVMVLNGRQFLQNFGQHARTVFGEDFWVDQVLPRPCDHTPGMDLLDHWTDNKHRLQQQHPDADIICVTDVRYPNEAQRIKDLGGEIWNVHRPGVESDGHDSETPLTYNLIDEWIVNDGTINQLKEKVRFAFLDCD